jgi:predicted nucleotidyltransferase
VTQKSTALRWREVCRRYGVKELSLFGSAIRGEMRPDSDIDILVEFEPGVRIGLIRFESLAEELESIAGRKSTWLPSGD